MQPYFTNLPLCLDAGINKRFISKQFKVCIVRLPNLFLKNSQGIHFDSLSGQACLAHLMVEFTHSDCTTPFGVDVNF